MVWATLGVAQTIHFCNVVQNFFLLILYFLHPFQTVNSVLTLHILREYINIGTTKGGGLILFLGIRPALFLFL